MEAFHSRPFSLPPAPPPRAQGWVSLSTQPQPEYLSLEGRPVANEPATAPRLHRHEAEAGSVLGLLSSSAIPNGRGPGPRADLNLSSPTSDVINQDSCRPASVSEPSQAQHPLLLLKLLLLLYLVATHWISREPHGKCCYICSAAWRRWQAPQVSRDCRTGGGHCLLNLGPPLSGSLKVFIEPLLSPGSKEYGMNKVESAPVLLGVELIGSKLYEHEGRWEGDRAWRGGRAKAQSLLAVFGLWLFLTEMPFE